MLDMIKNGETWMIEMVCGIKRVTGLGSIGEGFPLERKACGSSRLTGTRIRIRCTHGPSKGARDTAAQYHGEGGYPWVGQELGHSAG